MSILKNKLEIKRVPYSKLTKWEASQFSKKVIGIVEKHDPELMEIKQLHDNLVAQMPQIEVLDVRYGVDPVRLDLKSLKENLMLKSSAIKLQVRMLGKTNDKRDLHVIQSSLDSYLLYLSESKNDEEVEQKIKGFIQHVKTDEELKAAMIEYNLMPFVEELELALTDVTSLSVKRVSLLSQRPKASTHEVTSLIVDALDNLFKDIEVAPLRNPELDYAPLINELNVLCKQLRTKISIREANNRRKANGEIIDDTEDGSINEPGESTTEEGTSIEVQNMVENGNGTDKPSDVYVASIKQAN